MAVSGDSKLQRTVVTSSTWSRGAVAPVATQVSPVLFLTVELNKAALMCGNSRLAGRGTVEITIEKSDGSTFQAEAEVDIDGYSAPVTAGNSAKLVR
ncbi:hypothetical protein F2Q69_00038270 [Brassica cretica]|uniref:Uncharacterized protein n=2 Tax=Brassica cretica TaxID=69181 RepID=A0A8S9SLI0_BRACR|nr:hypothetical protein F2Q69_00038270 [Brassica cretica]